jgi:hypothetical protein
LRALKPSLLTSLTPLLLLQMRAWLQQRQRRLPQLPKRGRLLRLLRVLPLPLRLPASWMPSLLRRQSWG